MDVQRSNFAEAAEVFRESVAQCSLIALDLEFTGVRGRPESFIDSAEERYSGLRRVASTFKIIQVGLCTFTQKENGWEARPFNFFVFPSEVPGFNQRVVLEVGAINFLKEHHMDFNNWFYNGVPYLNEAQSRDLEGKLKEVSEENLEDIVLSKTYEQVKMNEITFRIEKWLENSEETFVVAGLNAFLRKYLYNFVKKRYTGIFMESIKVEGSRDVTLSLKKAHPELLMELEAKRIKEKVELFNEKIGFRRIFTMMIESRKPLIVHNGSLDILFTLAAFQEELPEKYQDFKTLTNRLFPIVFDTRFLLEKIPGLYEEFDKASPGKGLKELYNFLKTSNGPQFVLGTGFEKYYDEKFAHEAGFDAFMTGICFIRLLEKNAVEQYKNFLPLYRSFYSIRLDGPDFFANDNHFYIKGAEAKQLFANSEGYSVKYVKDDECFVKPSSEDKYTEMHKITSDHNILCMSAEAYFESKNKNSDKPS